MPHTEDMPAFQRIAEIREDVLADNRLSQHSKVVWAALSMHWEELGPRTRRITVDDLAAETASLPEDVQATLDEMERVGYLIISYGPDGTQYRPGPEFDCALYNEPEETAQ